MPFTPRDIAPFLTPYVSANEWSDANARMFRTIDEGREGILRAQASVAQAAAARDAVKATRAQTTAYQQEQLKLRQQAQEAADLDKDQALLSKFFDAQARGDDLEAERLMPELALRNLGFEPKAQPAPAPAPVAPTPAFSATPLGTLQSFGAAPATATPPHMTPLQQPMSPESQELLQQIAPKPLEPLVAPPAPGAQAQPAPSQVYVVTRNGKPFKEVDLGLMERIRERQRNIAMTNALRMEPEASREAAAAAWRAANAAPGTIEEQIKRYGELYNPSANRAARLQGDKYRDAAAARQARLDEQKLIAENTKLARVQTNDAVRHMRTNDKELGAANTVQNQRALVSAQRELTAAKDSPAAATIFQNNLYTMATSREPGALNRQDIENTVGLRGFWSKLEKWVASNVTGELSPDEYNALQYLMRSRAAELENRAKRDYIAQQTFAKQMYPVGSVAWNAAQAYQAQRYGQMSWWAEQRKLEGLPVFQEAPQHFTPAFEEVEAERAAEEAEKEGPPAPTPAAGEPLPVPNRKGPPLKASGREPLPTGPAAGYNDAPPIRTKETADQRLQRLREGR